MTDERLSSLAILHIHNFDKDANDNVAQFAHQKGRRWKEKRRWCFKNIYEEINDKTEKTM